MRDNVCPNGTETYRPVAPQVGGMPATNGGQGRGGASARKRAQIRSLEFVELSASLDSLTGFDKSGMQFESGAVVDRCQVCITRMAL